MSTPAVASSQVRVKIYGPSIQVIKPIGGYKERDEREKKFHRKEIKKFTHKSKRTLMFWFNVHGEKVDRIAHLTYPAEYPRDIRKAQEDLRLFLKWLERMGVTVYLWIKEFQKN